MLCLGAFHTYKQETGSDLWKKGQACGWCGIFTHKRDDNNKNVELNILTTFTDARKSFSFIGFERVVGVSYVLTRGH